MVVGSQGLNAFYASKAAHQHQHQNENRFAEQGHHRPAQIEAATYSEVDAAMSNPYDPIAGGSVQTMASFSSSSGHNCPCVTKRQSITRTSAIICTCNPSAPRQITISPSVSNTNLAGAGAGAHAFQYQRSHKFGSPATSPLSDASAAVVAASSSHGMDTSMDSGGDMMMLGAEDATMIVDVPDGGMIAKRSLEDDVVAGHVLDYATSGRQSKRLRTDNMGPSAATILCSRAPPSMSPSQRDELCRLLQHSSAVGSISYADVVQHFAQKGMWLNSEVTTWLLHTLGQN